MTIVCPADAEEMERFMKVSVDWPHPIYIRLAKGYDPIVTDPDKPFVIGQGQMYREGSDVLLVTTGIGLRVCRETADLLEKRACPLPCFICRRSSRWIRRRCCPPWIRSKL